MSPCEALSERAAAALSGGPHPSVAARTRRVPGEPDEVEVTGSAPVLVPSNSRKDPSASVYVNTCSILPDYLYDPTTKRLEIGVGSPCLVVGASPRSPYTQTEAQVCLPVAGESYASCVRGPLLTQPPLPDPGEESIGRFDQQGETSPHLAFGAGPGGPGRKAVAIAIIVILLALLSTGGDVERGS